MGHPCVRFGRAATASPRGLDATAARGSGFPNDRYRGLVDLDFAVAIGDFDGVVVAHAAGRRRLCIWSWRRQVRATGAVVTSVAVWLFWPAQAKDSVAWTAFDSAKLEQWIQSPEPVLVNVTADWCISCLSNERLVFSDAEIAQLDVRFIKADWTEYDPDITAYLDRFNRAGVPLYVVYSQGEVECCRKF